MSIPENVVIAFVAGFFGLVPLMVQWATTRAQRRDRSTRLNNLRTELEFLERLSTVLEETATEDDSAKLQTKLRVQNAVSHLLDQYNALPKAVPFGGDVKRSITQRPLFSRILLLYQPKSALGWWLHTLFYVILLMFATLFILVSGHYSQGFAGFDLRVALWTVVELAPLWIMFSLTLLILQRLARRAELRDAVRSEDRYPPRGT